MIEIKKCLTNEIIFKSESATTVKAAVLEAIEENVNLSGADLSGADLSGADLSGADLSGADLSGADLSGANLCYCKMDKKVFKQITEEWFEWKIDEEEKK